MPKINVYILMLSIYLGYLNVLFEYANIYVLNTTQPRPQGLLFDDFQNGGSSGEDPEKGWVTWYKISKNLGDFYHVTF